MILERPYLHIYGTAVRLPQKTWTRNLPRGSFSDVAVMFCSAMSQVKNDNFRAIIEPFLTHSYVPDPVLDLWTVDSVDGWDAQVLGGIRMMTSSWTPALPLLSRRSWWWFRTSVSPRLLPPPTFGYGALDTLETEKTTRSRVQTKSSRNWTWNRTYRTKKFSTWLKLKVQKKGWKSKVQSP